MATILRYGWLALIIVLVCITAPGGIMLAEDQAFIQLPSPKLTGKHSLEQLLNQRRSVRDYQEVNISLAELGQLLWAAQGITHSQGLRTAPSAGALYPLELYIAVGRVEGLAEGTYHYDPRQHRLERVGSDDKRKSLARSAYFQSSLKEAAVVMVFGAIYERTRRKYGKRAERYVHIEVGHAAQNVYLQAEALGLGTVMIGAFSDKAVASILRLPKRVMPLGLMPIGRKR